VASSGKPFESTTATTHSRSQKWRFYQRHEEQNKKNNCYLYDVQLLYINR
jgi:hypothetical protein